MRIASLVLPRADNDGADLADVHLALQSVLVDRFGGFTAIESRGGWRDDSTGQIYIESGVLYQIAMNESEVERNALESIALFYGHMATQISVFVVHANGRAAFIDCKPSPALAHAALSAD